MSWVLFLPRPLSTGHSHCWCCCMWREMCRNSSLDNNIVLGSPGCVPLSYLHPHSHLCAEPHRGFMPVSTYKQLLWACTSSMKPSEISQREFSVLVRLNEPLWCSAILHEDLRNVSELRLPANQAASQPAREHRPHFAGTDTETRDTDAGLQNESVSELEMKLYSGGMIITPSVNTAKMLVPGHKCWLRLALNLLFVVFKLQPRIKRD